MTIRGLGDRWLSGEPIEGIDYALHDRVTVVGGPNDGDGGSVTLLLGPAPDPLYLVTLDAGGRAVRLRQSELYRAEG